MNNCVTPDEMAKVRYVAKGYSNRYKPYLVHDTSTLRISSIRIAVSISSVMRFRLFSHDVTQAYLQIKSNLSRNAFIRPKKDERKIFRLNEVECPG